MWIVSVVIKVVEVTDVDTIMKFGVSQTAGNILSGWETVSF